LILVLVVTDLDPDFYHNADPDPGSQIDADPNPV